MSPDDLTDAAASADAPPESAEEILHTDNLVKAYRGRRVVDQVSLSVREGEIVGLLGPNGAGKTTTFRMVVGMVTPDQGTVTLNGEDVTRQPMYRRARRGLGYLAQQESVFKKMSAIDNIRCVLEARGMKRADREDREQGTLPLKGGVHRRPLDQRPHQQPAGDRPADVGVPRLRLGTAQQQHRIAQVQVSVDELGADLASGE